jgi:hypothetical protein
MIDPNMIRWSISAAADRDPTPATVYVNTTCSGVSIATVCS